MAGYNQGDDGDEGGDEKLPRPEVALEEEGLERKDGADNAAHRLGTEVQDKPRQETAETDEQSLEGAVELLEDIGKTHRGSADGTDETHVNPHLQDDVLVERAVVGALVVLVKEVNHQRRAHQWDTQPNPAAPVLVPLHECQKLNQQEECRRVAPGQKQVLTRQFLATHDFAPDAVDYFQLVLHGSHSRSFVYKINITAQR